MKWLIDAGHGGRAFGAYVTPGKRSPDVPPGIYEGVFNRNVARLLIGENIVNLSHGVYDTPPKWRVKAINTIAAYHPGEVALISIHANATGRGKKWDERATGFRIFTSKKPSEFSVTMARVIERAFIESAEIPASNREILGRNYTILKHTKCPSVLIECGFMTALHDIDSLNKPHIFAKAIARAIRALEGITK